MNEQPLHVRVAEALGWDTAASLHSWDEAAEGYRGCTRCDQLAHWNGPEPELCVPRYGTDWSATGPLIERYKIQVWHQEDPLAEILGPLDGPWRATHEVCASPDLGACTGPTPLIAVCNLILALKEAGKL